MIRTTLAAATLAAALAGAPPALAQDKPKEPTPAALATVAGKLAPSLVQVEWTAQYDKGESPGGGSFGMGAWRRYMAGAGMEFEAGWDDWDETIKEERPSLRGGYLISDAKVYTADPMLHPRFLKSVRVRFGDKVVDAKPAAYAKVGEGIVLELTSPLAGAKPLQFDPSKPGPYRFVGYSEGDGVWTTKLGSVDTGVSVTSDKRSFSDGAPGALVVDKEGTPVAICTGAMPADDSWKNDPSKMATVTADQMQQVLGSLEAETAKSLLRVSLHFRSPRTDGQAENPYARMYGSGDGEDAMTEWNGLGVLVEDKTVLVLANLKPKVTGRLERVTIHLPDGATKTATFGGTLKDWGAFLAKLEEPMPGAARFSTGDVRELRDELLAKAEVTVRGDTRTAYFSRARTDSFYTSFKGRVFPHLSAARGSEFSPYGSAGSESLNFFYTLDGLLVGLPIERRERVSTESRYGWNPGGGQLVAPVALIAELLASVSASVDAENRPLTEEEENRLAWLGVEMQAMDPELARASDVMDETNGGASGAVVTYMYPDSPAAAAGIEVGDILLRLEIEGQPKPLEVQLADFGGGDFMEQFWANIDQIPGEYFDRMPKPWGSAENALTRALTDVGFGTPFVAHIWRNGAVVKKDMLVTQGPAYFDSAPRYKAPESIGITVRNLTYEVRRYFQMAPDDPGVIISKIESGSRAAVAGLKPFEIIRTADDKPIGSVKDFEALVKAGGEVKLAVKRMTQGRTVKLKLDAPKGGEEPAGDDEPGRPEAAADGDTAPQPATLGGRR